MRHTRIGLAAVALIMLAAAGSALAQVTTAPSFDAALKSATDNDQLLIVDFYTDW